RPGSTRSRISSSSGRSLAASARPSLPARGGSARSAGVGRSQRQTHLLPTRPLRGHPPLAGREGNTRSCSTDATICRLYHGNLPSDAALRALCLQDLGIAMRLLRLFGAPLVAGLLLSLIALPASARLLIEIDKSSQRMTVSQDGVRI